MAPYIDNVSAVPHPIIAGTEMAELQRFFRDCTWKGTIAEGGMGPGTPEMIAEGRGMHKAVQDGLWIVGEYEQDQYLLDGTFVLKWQLHWVVGWDPDAAEYRGTYADDYGHAGVMRGRLEGDILSFETIGDGPVSQRMIWNLTDPDVMRWRNEISVNGAPFSLVEEYDFAFTGEARATT